MIKEEYEEPGASPSSLSDADNNMASNTGSSFEQENEGLANESGAAVTVDMVMSMTDITLDQALIKMREIDRENVLLKDHLAENNQQIKRQFEVLRSLNAKDKMKVDQFKALISSLREEIKELQIKDMTHEDKEKENLKKVAGLEGENAHLQRQKTLSEQRVINIMNHAKIQGVHGLDDMDGLPDVSDAVLVSTEDKEREIENLEASLTDKEEMITDLRSDLLTSNNQRDQYKMSNEILLRDMEGLQKQKEQMDRERRQLHEQNVHLSKELDQLMQSNIASTKKEINVQMQVVEEKKTQALDVSGFLDNAENLEEMFDQKVNLQQQQEEITKLTVDFETLNESKLDIEEKLKAKTKEFDELKSKHTLAQGRIRVLEEEKTKMSVEFEENLTSITHQTQENEKIQQAKVSEDQSALRSQVISLLSDNDDMNKKISAANMALQQKDRRITELTAVNVDWKEKFEEQWVMSSSMIQNMQEQLSKQDITTRQHIAEHNATKQLYQSLQDNFNRLVTDYKELLETFENERHKTQQQTMSKETMEEMNKMAAQVIAAEEAINYRDNQLDDFKKKCCNMDETIKLLHIQLETFQADFGTERDSRTQIAQEKSALEEDLRRSQEQVKNLTEQQNKRQMEDIQRRVNQTQRPPNYTDAQRLHSFQHSSRDPITPPHPHQMDAYPPLHPGMLPYGQTHQMNAAGGAHFDDLGADQYPSLVHECPTCGLVLPDTDSLQLHVPDCLDRQQQQQ